MKSGVCTVIVTYKIGRGFLKCFNSIENQVKEIIIVDNGSDKETISVLNNLEKTCNNVKVLYNEENLGIAAAQNKGVKYAIEKGYTWVLTLDHDSEATPHMVDKLLNTYRILSNQNINNIGIIAAQPVDKNTQEYLTEKRLFNADGEVKEVDKCISSGSLIKSCVFEEVGFFNESLFLYYVDDDFCLRCRNNKWKIYTCRSPVLFHQEGAKEIKKILWKKCVYDNYRFNSVYYIWRNTIYMLMNHYKYRKYCYFTVKRVCIDTMKIVLFDRNKTKLLYFMIKGFGDGIRGKYGRLVSKGDNS